MSQVSIGQVKRDLSILVNRVAYSGERIVLTSRGKPKAALVSVEDYRRLQEGGRESRSRHWRAWLAEADALSQEIMNRRQGAVIDVDELRQHDRQDLEDRIEWPGGD
ncbi:MAG: type II toxin-antitoxin system prevent-host-death family antitoxin [bacterium]|nr:type II toxin-antitoxin system prevent-host-death family antitoxin [bacterium]